MFFKVSPWVGDYGVRFDFVLDIGQYGELY